MSQSSVPKDMVVTVGQETYNSVSSLFPPAWMRCLLTASIAAIFLQRALRFGLSDCVYLVVTPSATSRGFSTDR